MRKTVLTHGPSGAGPSGQRAVRSGELVWRSTATDGDTNPSTEPVFLPPFSSPAPAAIDLAAYTGTLYVNPQGGSINISQAVVWAPAP